MHVSLLKRGRSAQVCRAYLLTALVWAGLWVSAFAIGDADSRRAQYLRQEGQRAMRTGKANLAIARYHQSLRLDPTLTQNHLSLAVAYLQTNKDALACVHLARYIDAHPEHHIIRSFYADLLLRLGHVDLAAREYRRFLEIAEETPEMAVKDLIHCHWRLVEIAEAQDDLYSRYLHRGIALYLMAQQRSTLPDPNGELPVEGFLCKAVRDFSSAHRLRPRQARPCWYLHLLWSKLGHSLQAGRYLCKTQAREPFSDLTGGERRALIWKRVFFEP